MTPCLFNYPASALLGRSVTKNKIYTHARASKKVQQLFVQQVESIVWQYKLSPETINIQATKNIRELHIFNIKSKTPDLALDVLRSIDMAIPFPLIFEIYFEDTIKVMATYKRYTAEGKTLLGEYLSTDWIAQTNERTPLPIALNLRELYTQLLAPLAPHPIREYEKLDDWMVRLQEIARLEKEIQVLENKIKKEKQFNRKVSLNGELKQLIEAKERMVRS